MESPKNTKDEHIAELHEALELVLVYFEFDALRPRWVGTVDYDLALDRLREGIKVCDSKGPYETAITKHIRKVLAGRLEVSK